MHVVGGIFEIAMRGISETKPRNADTRSSAGGGYDKEYSYLIPHHSTFVSQTYLQILIFVRFVARGINVGVGILS